MNKPTFECEDCIGMAEHGCYCAAMGAEQPGGPQARAIQTKQIKAAVEQSEASKCGDDRRKFHQR
jgi:hypothetical protein